MKDELIIGGRTFNSRLLLGTGKFSSLSVMEQSIDASGADIVPGALGRANMGYE